MVLGTLGEGCGDRRRPLTLTVDFWEGALDAGRPFWVPSTAFTSVWSIWKRTMGSGRWRRSEDGRHDTRAAISLTR